MKIVIISQHLFPMQTPRAHRTTELAKELSRLGNDVVIYAVLGKYDYTEFERENKLRVKPIPVKFQYHPYSSDADGKRVFIDKVLGKLFGKIFEFPYIEFLFNIPKILKKENDIDLLISIADPHHIHWGCVRAKRRLKDNFARVWIADCGDPFMSNGLSTDHLSYFSTFEKRFCKACDYITVPIEAAKAAYYPEYRAKINVVPQGFEFDLHGKASEPNNSVPTFAYAGTFYRDIRNPKLILDHLSSLKEKFKFIIYTNDREMVLPYLSILGEKIELKKPIPRKQLLKELEKMDFLLNIENNDIMFQVPSKLIDYAITQRPILSLNPRKLETNKISEFLAKNYSNSTKVENLNQYHITHVAQSFLKLYASKKTSNSI